MNIIILNKNEFLKKTNLKSLSSDFSTQKRNIEYSLGRFIVKIGANKFFNINEYEIAEINKKPFIKDNLFYFSISHSNEIIGVAFSNEEIGFDIELMKDRNFDKIARYMKFTCKNKEDFYKQWTKFEAEYKSKIKNSLNFIFKEYMCAISKKEITEYNLYEISKTYNNIDLNNINYDKIILSKITTI